MPETKDSVEPYIHCVFSYTVTGRLRLLYGYAKGMIHVRGRMAQDFIMILRTTWNIKLIVYVWNFSLNVFQTESSESKTMGKGGLLHSVHVC